MRRCPDCSLSGFESRGSLRKHRREVHGFVVCSCRRKFLKNEYMEQHRAMSSIHGYFGIFKCAACLDWFTTERQLLEHQRSLCNTGINKPGTGKDTNQYASISSLTQMFEGLDVTTWSDMYTLKREDIDTFIAKNIQVDPPYRSCCGEVIDIIVKKLHQIGDFAGKLEPREIIKSGSLGKGTAVKDRSDIDLVMMLRGYDDVGPLMRDMHGLLEDLHNYLSRFTQARPQRRTRYSVQVEITCKVGHTHDADILPAVDLIGLGNSPEHIFRMMEHTSKDVMHEYSVSLAPLQLEIIKPLPAKVKSLIKLLKYWKDKKLKNKNEAEMPSFAEKRIGKPNWPSSYALELVVINAWNEAENPESFDMTKVLHAVLSTLVNHRSLRVLLKQKKYDTDMAQISKTPYIMDPANPFNDMYHGLVGGEAFDWDQVVSEAQVWLSKPLFYGVNTSKKW